MGPARDDMCLWLSVALAAAGCGAPPDAAPADAAARADAAIDAAIDAAAPDAPPADAAATDAGPLTVALDGAPYLALGTGGGDLRTAVRGGQPPYRCERYRGPGEGTLPIGASFDAADGSGCVVRGGVAPERGDAPGDYGIIAIVRDQAGNAVELPIALLGPSCSTAAAALEPTTQPAAVQAPGAAQRWLLAIDDLAAIAEGERCEPCLTLSLLTRGPLAIAPALDCAQDGDLCSDCEACLEASACPGPARAARPIELREHRPVRAAGAPAWVTVAIDATYAGGDGSLDPCGDRRWRCHVELLEVLR